MKGRRVPGEQLLVDVLAHVQPHQDLLHISGHAGLVQRCRHLVVVEVIITVLEELCFNTFRKKNQLFFCFRYIFSSCFLRRSLRGNNSLSSLTVDFSIAAFTLPMHTDADPGQQ